MTYLETQGGGPMITHQSGDARAGIGAVSLPISVVIPVHNRARLLEQALKSVEAQRPRGPAQVIVVDDASSDGSREVAERWGADVIVHPHNRGAPAAYQTGLEAVREQWVALLDSDDEWLPHHLDALWALAPGNVLVACSCLEVGVDGDGYGYHGLIGDRPVMLDSPAGILYPENPIPSSGAMFSRDAALAVGGFREMLCEDLDLWCRLMARGPATLSPHVGILYRTHAGQISADWAAMHAAHLGIIRELARGSRGSHGDLFERRSGVSAWDRFRVRRRARNPGARRDLVAELLRHPRRALGVIDVLGHRLATSRRASHLVREGPLSSPPRSPR